MFGLVSLRNRKEVKVVR